MLMKYESNIAKVVYEDAKAMYKAGGISKEELQRFKDMCFVPLFASKPKPSATVADVSLPASPVSK